MLALGLVLVLSVAAPSAGPSASPSPSPSPSAGPSDSCGTNHTNILNAINRPTVGYSSCAVKPADLFYEIGYANALTADQHTATYPQGFLRIGLVPNVEIDAIAPAFEVQRTGSQVVSGVLDSGFGAKYEYWHDSSTQAAIDFLYLAPTGIDQFSAHAPVETINFDAAHSLSPAVGVAATLGVQSDHAQSRSGSWGRFVSYLPSFDVTDQVSDNLQFYGEVYWQTPLRPDGGSLLGLDGGVQYLIDPALEVDVEAGRTITDLQRAHYYGFGFGVRF